ncbi:hypothetical protein MGN70_013806 [Eutypa lata]|nr:hypothetical protein MGN70_013806 [Eutypa lata]
MGGLAFASGEEPLYTPRMPPNVYRYVRDHCHKLLRQIFVCVATPIDGPAKKDYGDIDIVLAWEHKKTFPSTTANEVSQGLPEDPLQAVAHLLKAEKTKKEQPNSLMLAIPWPRELLESDNYGINDKESDKLRFIQVDLHYYQNIDQLHWMLFKHAHGDLWNILGSTIRPFGLTIDEFGLYLRIPEIEWENRKKAKILLTRSPAEILDFLGLESSGSQWELPFATFDDVFEYAATCRFFWVRASQPQEEGRLEHEEQTGGEFEKKKLKANDRRRMNQRALFRAWIDEFLPRCRDEGRFGEAQFTRHDVRDEAFARFGVQHEYEARLTEWRIQRQKETLWKHVIKASLPEDLDIMWRSCVASALKKIIMKDDEGFGIRPQVNLRDQSGLYNEDRVRDFVRASWKQVGDAAWRQNHAKFLDHLDKKGLKRTPADTDDSNAPKPSTGLSERTTVESGDGSKDIAVADGEGADGPA